MVSKLLCCIAVRRSNFWARNSTTTMYVCSNSDFSYSIQNTKKRKHHYLSSSESAFHSAVAYLRGKPDRGNRLKSCTINLKGHSASIYSGMSKKARVLREYNCTAPENVSMQYRWKMTNRACFGISGCMINEWWTLCYQYRYRTDTLTRLSSKFLEENWRCTVLLKVIHFAIFTWFGRLCIR